MKKDVFSRKPPFFLQTPHVYAMQMQFWSIHNMRPFSPKQTLAGIEYLRVYGLLLNKNGCFYVKIRAEYFTFQ